MNLQKKILFLLRVALGCLYLYAGMSKVLAPGWSAGGYLLGAKSFAGFYGWLAQPAVIPYVSLANEWALTLLGISLVLGLGVRLSAPLGALLMALYYLPLSFPYVNANSFIVDEHVIYGLVLLFLAAAQAGKVWGLDTWCAKLPICAKYPKLRNIFG